MNKLLLTDVDECILQWSTGFIQYLYDYHGFTDIKKRNDHYVSKWLEIHPDEAVTLVTEFNRSHYFAALEPFDSAHIVLPRLYNEGYKIVAITSCSSEGIVAEMRRINLQRYFGNIFSEVHCLDFFDDKGEVLNRYPKTFWVEDSIEWAVRGADLGHTTFLINHLHNESLDDPRIVRVDNWLDIYNMIGELADRKIS